METYTGKQRVSAAFKKTFTDQDPLMDVEALGNELRFPEDSLCISKKLALEEKGNLGSLQLVDPTKDGRLHGYLEALVETTKIVTDTAVSPVIAGPWTIAIGLRDANNLLRDAMKDPDYVHELMRFCTRQAMKNCLDAAPRDSGYILASGY